MKKLLFSVGILLCAQSNAQQNNEVESAEKQKMNIIKSNVTAYAFRNINLSYERAITSWFSVNVGFGTMPEGEIPFSSSFLKGEAEKEIQNVKVGLTHFTVEPRFYIGKGYGKGFYFAPYFRHSNFSTNDFHFEYDYEAAPGISYTVPLTAKGKASGNSAGLMVGAQFFLNKKQNFVLDFWILGAHYGSGNGEFTLVNALGRPLTPQEQQQLKSELENLDIPMVKYKVTTNANGADVALDGPWAGFRSGLSLGYRF